MEYTLSFLSRILLLKHRAKIDLIQKLYNLIVHIIRPAAYVALVAGGALEVCLVLTEREYHLLLGVKSVPTVWANEGLGYQPFTDSLEAFQWYILQATDGVSRTTIIRPTIKYPIYQTSIFAIFTTS